MKAKRTLKILSATLACIAFSGVVSATGFAKTKSYEDGQFVDVPQKAWFSNDVKSAYELGFVNGKSDTLYVPEGNVTVAEGITMASRVHAIYNGKTISEKSGGKWYDMYIDYAVENGLIEDNTYSNYDRNIMRYEMALLFANSLPKEYFAQKNDIKDIPDVAQTEDYYDELVMLYKAGVVLGSDDYGNFYATNPIKRSETAAIINRVALPENRVSGTLLEYGDRNQAIYLINDYSMTSSPRKIPYIASGWTYENTGLSNFEKWDYSSKNLIDNSSEHCAVARKTVPEQTSGKVVFESKLTISGNGASIIFEDADENIVFGVAVKDGKYKALGKTEVDTGVSMVSEDHRFYVSMNFDTRKATVVLNGKELGTFDMAQKGNLSAVAYKTGKEDVVTMGLSETHMYTQYAVNDTFRMAAEAEKLYGWQTSESVSVQTIVSDYDKFSASVKGKGKALKKFDKISGKFVYETFVRLDKTQSGTLELKNGEKTAVKVEIGNGKITSEGKLVRECDIERWTLVRVEGDTETGKAVVRVNGKPEGVEVALSEKEIDTVLVTTFGSGKLLFDDVQIYNVYDYADYVPKPEAVNNDDFYLGMNICSLWREGTHYGWDCISPYDDIQPLMGYYDEGLPEVADWEIKFLAEHGYDFENFCWYYYKNRFADGIKEPTMGFALHDGYMNAKYSDMVKFAIIWENGGDNGITKDVFYNEIWPYWCEWYLTDSRYMKVENKAVITILSDANFINQMGGVAEAEAAIDFMREDVKKLGYDGLIVLSAVFGSVSEKSEADKIGIDGFIAYHLGEAGYNPEHQKKMMNSAFDNSKTPLLSSVGVGFNDIGWTEERAPLATQEAHRQVFEWAKTDYMPRLSAREGEEWMGKFAIANTWNEYGEGHYIMPTNLNGFGYLDGARTVFSTVSGKDDSKHFDVAPSDNQKARLCYLYQAQNIPIRRTYNVSETVLLAENKPVKVWNFENEADCALWESLAKTTPTVYDENEKALSAEALHNDSHIRMVDIPENYFNADEVRYVHVQMKTDAGFNTNLEFYYSSQQGNNWTYEKSARTTVGNNGEYVDYYLDMKGKPDWTGTIRAVRFDPMGTVGNFYIRKIELLSDEAANGFDINVSGNHYSFSSDFYKEVGTDIFVGANPSDGFYSHNGFYYEWNRWNGTLKLKTYTGYQFDFKAGSNIVLVDGKEKTISTNFEVVDGLPMLPIMFIYDNAEYTYEKISGGIKVDIKGTDTEKIRSSRKENQYEFELPGDNEGWTVYGGIGAVVDGGLMYIEAVANNGVYSPHMVVYNRQIDTADYNRVEVRFKPVFKNEIGDSAVSVYFTTQEQPNADEAKKVKVLLEDLKPDENGFYTVTFDLASNPLWQTTVTSIRFDAPHRWGSYYIDYVKVLKYPGKEDVGSLSGEVSVGETVSAVDFGNKDKFMIFNVADLSMDGSFRGKGSNADPNVVYREKLNLDASEIKVIKIEAKIPRGLPAEIYFTTQEGNNFNADNRFKFTSDSDEMKTYIIHTSTNKNWQGTICEIRIDPVAGADCAGLDFEWKALEFCKASQSGTGNTTNVSPALEMVRCVNFDSKDKFMIFNVADLSMDGSFRGKGSNADPNVVYREKLNLNASEINAIKIEAKIPKGLPAEIYFTTQEGNNFNADNRFKFTSDSDDMKTYVIYTSTNKNWQGTIYEIRIDPVAGADCAGLDFEWKALEFCK